MTIPIIHQTSKTTYPGIGVATADQQMRPEDWNQEHFFFNNGNGVQITSDGGSPPIITITVGGSSTSVGGDLLPSIDNTFNIGSQDLRWKNMFSAGVTSVGTYGNALVLAGVRATAPIPANQVGTFDSSIHIDSVGAGTMRFNCNGGDFFFGVEYGAQPIALFGPNNDLRSGVNWSPLTDNALSLGLINRRWNNIFATGSVRVSNASNSNRYIQFSDDGTNPNITADSGVLLFTGMTAFQFNGITLNSSLIPGTDNNFDVGSVTARWRNYFGAGTVSAGSGFQSNALNALVFAGANSGTGGDGTWGITTDGNTVSFKAPTGNGFTFKVGSTTIGSLVYSGGSVPVITIGSNFQYLDNSGLLVSSTRTISAGGGFKTNASNAFIVGNGFGLTWNGALTVDGGNNLFLKSTSGSVLTATGNNFLPQTDNLQDSGSLTQRWRNVFFGTTLSGGSLIISGITNNGGALTATGSGTWNVEATLGFVRFRQAGAQAYQGAPLEWYGNTSQDFLSVRNSGSGKAFFVAQGSSFFQGDVKGIKNDGSGAVGFFYDSTAQTVSAGAGFQTNASFSLTANAIDILSNGTAVFESISGFDLLLRPSSTDTGGAVRPFVADTNKKDLGSLTAQWRSIFFGTTLSGGSLVTSGQTFNGTTTFMAGATVRIGTADGQSQGIFSVYGPAGHYSFYVDTSNAHLDTTGIPLAVSSTQFWLSSSQKIRFQNQGATPQSFMDIGPVGGASSDISVTAGSGGNFRIQTTTSHGGSIYVDTDSAYDLGRVDIANLRFRTAYLTTAVSVGASFIKEDTGSGQFKVVTGFSNFNFGVNGALTNGVVYESFTGVDSWRPNQDGVSSIGRPAQRWLNGFYSGTVSVGTVGASSTVTSTTISAGGAIQSNATTGIKLGNNTQLSMGINSISGTNFVYQRWKPDLGLSGRWELNNSSDVKIIDADNSTGQFTSFFTVSAATGFQTNAATSLLANAVQITAGAGQVGITPAAGFNTVFKAGFIQPQSNNVADVGLPATAWRSMYFATQTSFGGTSALGSGFTTNTSVGMQFGGTAVTGVKTATGATELIPVVINGVTRYIQTFQNSN